MSALPTDNAAEAAGDAGEARPPMGEVVDAEVVYDDPKRKRSSHLEAARRSPWLARSPLRLLA
jgi:hypothetical protein